MGSAASTTAPTKDESAKKKSSTGSSNKSAKTQQQHQQQDVSTSSKHIPSQLIIDEPPPEQVTLFSTQDSNPEEKPNMSSNKLKKLALGIQGYKDQQRDYDTTLGNLDVNKTSQMQWSEPDVAYATPKSKGYHPTTPNRFKESESPFSSIPHANRAAPNHTPTQQYNHGRSTEKLPSVNSFHSGSAHDLTTTGSFSRPHGAGPTTPSHGVFTPGPPPGVPARPFPRNQEMDDGMSADFSSEHPLQKHPSKPQNIPALNIPNTPISNKTPPPNMGTPGGAHQGGVPMGMTGAVAPYQQALPPGAQGGPRPFMSPGPHGKNPAPFPGGSPPPRALGPRGPFPVPGGSPPAATLAAGITVLGPGAAGGGIMPMNVGPRPTAPMPVVKETTVVKRNKVDLPTSFNHAKPTAGDWLNKRYFVNNYILLDTLGVGSYGEVMF